MRNRKIIEQFIYIGKSYIILYLQIYKKNTLRYLVRWAIRGSRF